MLNMQSRVSLHRQALARGVEFITQQPMTSLMTVLMLSLVLVLVALFWNVSSSINQLTSTWQNNGHILLYLKVPTEAQEAHNLLTKVQATKGVQSAVLNTPQQGLDVLQQQDGMRDILLFLPDNPLPFVIDVVPATSIDTPARLETLYQQLKTYPQIDEASLDLAWMKRLFTLLHFFSHLLNGINVLLALAVILITGNTLRLMIRDRADEMQVFKLIGANDMYIMRPFLYSGAAYGLMAALLAWVCVNSVVVALNQKLNQLLSGYAFDYHVPILTFSQTCLLLLSASLLGWLGARLSARVVLSGAA